MTILNPILGPSKPATTVVVGVYVRYSCDQQRETSLEDQERRCREVIATLNLANPTIIVYSDAALSGGAKDSEKRSGYLRLLRDWDAGKFKFLVVDEYSRLSRDAVEQAAMMRRLESGGVRLITADGTDTRKPDWELTLGLKGLMGQHALRETRFRVARGMLGQLERGYLIADAPFGYDLKREFDEQGNRIGTHWVINEREAALVREIFSRRSLGQSYGQIARWLNESGVPTCRRQRTNGGGFWRASRVNVLLHNTIYRGEFTWNGSANSRAKAAKTNRELDIRVFQRPALRLVSDELWHRCNTPKTISRSGYGGGKHLLAGLVLCGCCGATLVVSGPKSKRSLYCATCTTAKNNDGQADRQTVTVLGFAVEKMLRFALKTFLYSDVISAFRERLAQRLLPDSEAELQVIRAKMLRLQRAQERLLRLLSSDPDDELVEVQYQQTRVELKKTEADLRALQCGLQAIDKDAISAQLAVDPATLLESVFAEASPERLRSVLSGLFPEIIYRGKRGRYASFFEVKFAPGDALGLATETRAILDDRMTQCFCVCYSPKNHKTPQCELWTVSQVHEHDLPPRVYAYMPKPPPLKSVGEG